MKKSYFVFVSIKTFYRATRCICCSVIMWKRVLTVAWACLRYIFFIFKNFFCVFSWSLSLGWRRERGRTSEDRRVLCSSQLVCFARKIKEHKYRFNLPMDSLYLSHFPLSVRTFECGFWGSSCPFATRIAVVPYGPRTVKLTTWPRDSPSSHLGLKGNEVSRCTRADQCRFPGFSEHAEI